MINYICENWLSIYLWGIPCSFPAWPILLACDKSHKARLLPDIVACIIACFFWPILAVTNFATFTFALLFAATRGVNGGPMPK